MLDHGPVTACRDVQVPVIRLVVPRLAPPDLVSGRQAAVEASLPHQGHAVVGHVDGLEVAGLVRWRGHVQGYRLGRVSHAVLSYALVLSVVRLTHVVDG